MRIVGLFLVAVCVSAQTIGSRIDKILLRSPAAQQAFWGIRVVDLETGATVYSKNQDQFFIPASNTKLFSTALALMRLGPDHRFRTTITSPTLPDVQGRVTSLRFVGGGDPNLSGRAIPYEYDAPRQNPLRHIEMFAEKLIEKGLRFVDGDIIGDDSAYAHEPFPEGWALDDPTYEYGTPVSALFLNDGMFRLVLKPGEFGEAARIECRPVVEGMVIHNLAVTGSETKLSYTRLPGTSELTIRGTIATEQQALLGIEEPALVAAQALRDELLKRGVRISGTTRVEHFPAPGVALVAHDSHPLIEDLRVVNKDSQNLHAEIALLEVSRMRLGVGSREASLIEMKEFLREIGVADRQYHVLDGSGLSRQTLFTPMTISKLLLYMYRSKHRDDWISTLPVGGKDGTLAKRFSRAAAAAKVHAKTGSITHVNGLSGYAGRYAFSILVNNSNLAAGPVRRVIDQVALTLAK